MNSDEFYEFEDRIYTNPTLSSGEQEAFIDNLRNIQGQNNTQIAQQTYNLGTDVPSNLGGLGGGESYFMSRYQTPQVDEMVATLKSAAQAQALNDVMSNYQAQLKQRYNNAYRRAKKRARSYGTGAGTNFGTPGVTKGNVNEISEDTSQATPEGLWQAMLSHRDAMVNTAKAKAAADERAKNVNQALNPNLNPTTSQEELINYWKNIRR